MNDMPKRVPIHKLGSEAVRVDRELKRMMGELPDPSPVPQVITAVEDREAREKELARRREKLELELLQRKLADYEAVKAEEQKA